MAVIFRAPYDEFMQFMTSSPSLRDIAEYRMSEDAEERIEYLLDQNGEGLLTPEERDELEDFLRVEHMMREAKLIALEKLAAR